MTEEYPGTPDDNLGARARAAAGWQFLAKGIRTALQMVTSIVLARLLMPDDFGIIAMATMVTGLGMIFQDLGLGQALVQRENISDRHTRAAFWGTLGMAALLYAAVFFSAPWVGAFFDEPRMIPVVRVIGLIFVLSPFAVVPRSLLQRDLDFKTQFYAGLVSSLAYGVVGIAMALLGFGYWALVGAPLAAGLANAVALCILTRYVPPLIPSFRGIGDLFGFGAGVTLSGMFAYLASKIDYFVIGRRLGADPLGLYTKAFELIELPTGTVSRVLTPVLFPSFAAMRRDLSRLRTAYGNMLSVVSFFGFPGMVVLAIVAPEAIPLVLGEQWSQAVLPLQIMVGVGMLKVLGPPAGAVIKATGYVYREMWQQMVRAVLLGVGAWFAAPYGIEWVAAVLVVSTAISISISSFIVYSAIEFGLRHFWRALAGPFLISIVVGGVTVGARSITLARTESMALVLVVSLAAALITYAAIAFLTNIRSAQLVRAEFRTLGKKLKLR